MAAFIIRGIGEFNPPVPPSQRFDDVSPSNPFYNFIDRMGALGITLVALLFHRYSVRRRL